MCNHGFEYTNVFGNHAACGSDRRQDCQTDEAAERDRISGNRIVDRSELSRNLK